MLEREVFNPGITESEQTSRDTKASSCFFQKFRATITGY